MRKSSKARLFSTCLTGAILAAASPAWGQTSDAPTWKPRAEVDAQVGKDIGVSTSLFAPIAQNDSSLVYVDGRIGYDQRFDRNGSATIGARVRVGEDVAIGVNAGADFYRSDIGSRDQAAVSMGLEGFTSVFDVRVNYRLPLSKIQTIGYIDPAATSSAALVLENNRLIERHSGFRLEAIPLQGFNGEAGVRLPVGSNASIRGSVGGFDYWDKDADRNYRGIRGGLEMDIEDRNSGARFTFGGTIEHDNRFGTDARATVRLSVPFGGRSGDRGAVPTGLDRQMGDRVRRDYVARSGSRYRDLTSSRFAVDARTGNEFGGFYYASGTGVAGAAGTLATPTTIADAVTRAGANGVVVALGSGGNITTPGVTLATNQYLLGGAGAVDVRLLNGGTAQFALGGTNGVIVGSNAAGATVTLGQGSVVRDVTIRGAGTGIAANGVGGFAIDRVIVENTGGAGISLTNTLGPVALTGLTVRGGAGAGVLVNGGSSVSLANSTISGGAGAVDINDGGANLAVSLSGLTLSATGGNVLDIDGSGAGTVTVTGLSGITIRGGTGETGGLSVRSATFDANTTTAGIQTVNAGRMEVGTTAARVNGQGVFLTDVIGSLSFTDLDIANSGATGLHVVNSQGQQLHAGDAGRHDRHCRRHRGRSRSAGHRPQLRQHQLGRRDWARRDPQHRAGRRDRRQRAHHRHADDFEQRRRRTGHPQLDRPGARQRRRDHQQRRQLGPDRHAGRRWQRRQHQSGIRRIDYRSDRHRCHRRDLQHFGHAQLHRTDQRPWADPGAGHAGRIGDHVRRDHAHRHCG
jgi:hypothetical protein